jgi:hypothetical protein
MDDAAESILNALEMLQDKLQSVKDLAENHEEGPQKEELLSVSAVFDETLGKLVSAVSFHDLCSQRLEKVKDSTATVLDLLKTLSESVSSEPSPRTGGGYAGKPRGRFDKAPGGFRGKGRDRSQGKEWSKDKDQGDKWSKDKDQGGKWAKDKDKGKKTVRDKDKGKPKFPKKERKAKSDPKPELMAKDSEKKRRKAPPSDLKGPRLNGLAQSEIDRLLSELNDRERKD